MNRRIAAIVINSVSHDARVLKQADSLGRAGYDVTILGIRDNRCDDPVTIRSGNVRIIRVDWKRSTYAAISTMTLVAGLAFITIAVAVHLTQVDAMVEWIQRLSTEAWVQRIRNLTFDQWYFAAGFPIIGVIGYFFYRSWRRAHAIVRRIDAAENGVLPMNSSGSWRARIRKRVYGVLSTRIMRQRMLRELIAIHPEAVHCHDISALPVGWRYKKRSGCRLVYDSHEIHEELSLATPAQRKRSERKQRRYANKVDVFITINDSIGTYLSEKYPALPAPIIVKNAAKLPEAPVYYDGRLHDAAKLDRETKILLYQGGFARLRGLIALVQSASILPEGWKLVMMGWGAYETALRAAAEQSGPGSSGVCFLPAVPQHELIYWTAGASLGVIPYENVCLNHWYCTPNKLWEYPIAGVPLLVSPFPEMESVVVDHDIGWLLDDPVTPENIARTVALITNEDLSQKQRHCLTYVAQDHWNVYARRLVRGYDVLLGVKRSNTSRGVVETVAKTSKTPNASKAARHARSTSWL